MPAWGDRVRGSDKIPLFTRINARWIAHAYQEHKTKTRNGETLKQALAQGRCGKQGTTRMLLRAGLLKKQKPGVMSRIGSREHDHMEERGTTSMAQTKAPRDKRNPPLDPESESWRTLPWRKFEQHVYRIQKRIFRAKQRGNQRAVQKVQKL